jgi:hypothetical protein
VLVLYSSTTHHKCRPQPRAWWHWLAPIRASVRLEQPPTVATAHQQPCRLAFAFIKNVKCQLFMLTSNMRRAGRWRPGTPSARSCRASPAAAPAASAWSPRYYASTKIVRSAVVAVLRPLRRCTGGSSRVTRGRVLSKARHLQGSRMQL